MIFALFSSDVMPKKLIRVQNEKKRKKTFTNYLSFVTKIVMLIFLIRENKARYTAKDAFLLILIVILVKNGCFAWFQLVCDRRTDGQTYPLIEMRECI